MLTLCTLGSLDLLGSDGEGITAILSQPKRYALLVYLAVARPGGFHRRDTLLDLFWPEGDDARGRNALSQSLSHLRRNLPGDVIVSRGAEEVGLNPEMIQVDVDDFEVALLEGRWAEALDLYGGDFLPGFHVGGSGGFEEWMAGERERLREAAAGGAWSLAKEQIEGGALVEAERTAQRAIDLVCTDESPVRGFIQALAEAGDRAAALNFYERFAAKLREKLELDPSPRTVEVAEEIRNGDWSTPPERLHGAPGLPDAPDPGSVTEAPERPSEGRREPLAVKVRKGGKLGKWGWVGLAVVAAAVLVMVPGLKRDFTVGPPPTDRPFTVLAQVGGSADLDERECVASLLRNGLDMAHVVRTVPVTEVGRVLGLMGRDPSTALSPALAREIAVRLGVGTVVISRLDRIGDHYVLSLRVEDVQEGHLWAEARGTAGVAEVVRMVDDVAREIRGKLGETRAVLAATQPLPQVFTPSLEALKKYQAAGKLSGSSQTAQAAVSLLWEAVALDTAFAMAWQMMAATYGNRLNEPDSSAFADAQVRRFPERISEARRLDQELHRGMREDVALWDRALEDAERAVLKDPSYVNNYAVYLAYEAGLPDSAFAIRMRLEAEWAEFARRFDAISPYSTNCFINTHYWGVGLQRIDEWLTLLDTLEIDVPPDCRREVELFESLAAGEWDRAERMLRADSSNWRWPEVVETAARQLVPLRGRVHAAHRRPAPENGEKWVGSRGRWSDISHLLLQLAYGLPPEEAPEGVFGDGGDPRELRGRGREEVMEYVLYGVREALLGDTLEARRVARRLQAMRDSATSSTFERAFEPWFVLMDVGPGVQRGDWPYVIEHLDPVAGGIHDAGVGFLAGDAYVIWWLLADAYIQVGQPESAISYLDSILVRPRTRVQDWTLQGFIHPAARFKLAGLYAEVGDSAGAREQYRIFLDTFTDPDPDFEWMVEGGREGLAALGG